MRETGEIIPDIELGDEERTVGKGHPQRAHLGMDQTHHTVDAVPVVVSSTAAITQGRLLCGASIHDAQDGSLCRDRRQAVPRIGRLVPSEIDALRLLPEHPTLVL